MGVFDKAKNAAKHTKLKGEIVLLDRDVKSKKQAFGVELSDLLWDIEAKQKAVGGRESTYLKALHNEWGVARKDLQDIRDKKEEINAKLAVASAEAQERSSMGEDTRSAMDKAKAAGTEGKRRTKLQLLERELKGRKQQFGMDVYEAAVNILCQTAAQGGGSTMTDAKNKASASAASAVDSNKKMSFMEKQLAKAAISTVSSAMNQLTVSDQDIEKCILKVKTDVEALLHKKNTKKAEIEQLGQKPAAAAAPAQTT